jgi:hypothetical protein
MSHIVGTIQAQTPPAQVGPDSGAAPTAPNTWTVNFAHSPAPTGTKFLILHFQKANLPANNRLEVELGYDTDVFTSADGTDFWTRPVNIYALPGGLVPIHYITNGSTTGMVEMDRYGRGERHPGVYNPMALSNCDPFLKDPTYVEPIYDPFWYCSNPPNWENIARVVDPADVRIRVARSVGMMITVETQAGAVSVSTCSVTLVDADKVISAGHCHTPAEALTGSVTFDYLTDLNGNRPLGYNAKFFKIINVLKHRYDSGGDYSLLQLASSPAGIPAIQTRPDVPGAGEQVFGVHHPNGAVKKLSIPHPAFDTVLTSSATAVTVPGNFAVSGGSSGSGLFDTAGRIVGILSNGSPCSTTPVPLSYWPIASVLLDIAPAPPPPVTRDVMVVFDRSGSMSLDDGTGRAKIDSARDAASLFVQLVSSGAGDRVGLVSFSTAASSPADFDIAPVVAASKTALVGPAPYSGGKVGALLPGGATSIGDGLDKARLQLPAPGANPRAILLMTDGLQNTPPMIDAVQGALTGIDVHAIGYGTEASLNGALLSALAAGHNGLYTRAGSGLALEKFFSHAFGNIFQAGTLIDPEFQLGANQSSGSPQTFQICGEVAVTVVVGWDRPDATLAIEVTTPGGAAIAAGSAGIGSETGRTWTFLRIPLPHAGERDGTWTVTVFRPGGRGEFPPPAPALRYFINVIPTGGPRLSRLPDDHRYYTGDPLNPMVLLRYDDGTWPDGAKVRLTVSKPESGAGNILAAEKLGPPVTLDLDTFPARQATLLALERAKGQPLIGYKNSSFDLGDDPENTNGRMEPAAIFGKPLTDLLDVEGNYTLHFVATYGDDCAATRELLSSLHVDVGIDPGKTEVTTILGGRNPDGSRDVTVVITPRDRYGNHVGPGRNDGLRVTGVPGTSVTGPAVDNGDGSYTIPGRWRPGSGHEPGVVIEQPGRPPAILQAPRAVGKQEDEDRLSFPGKVRALVFDHFGDFEAFILETEDGERRFLSREHAVRRLVEHAWEERIGVIVVAERHDALHPVAIILREVGPEED